MHSEKVIDHVTDVAVRRDVGDVEFKTPTDLGAVGRVMTSSDARWVIKVDATAAVVAVDLAGMGFARIGPVLDSAAAEVIEDAVEVVFGDEKAPDALERHAGSSRTTGG